MRTKMLSRQPFIILIALMLLAAYPLLSWAKSQDTISESIKIEAPPEAVFEALRNYRTAAIDHRKLISFDGKNAIIEEELQAVPMYGKVHCLWLEKEIPYERIDYTLLKSNKLSSGSGSYIISNPEGHGASVLELVSQLQSQCHMPLAREISLAASRKDMRARLQYIKHLAEDKRLSAKH